jgi:hypothetical protein
MEEVSHSNHLERGQTTRELKKKIRSHENHKNIVFKIRRSGKIAEEIKKIKERKNPHQSEQLKKDHS